MKTYKSDTIDETKIREELAETIAKDPNNIDRLGKGLVARHETAVSELVKNAYNADASEATLHFSNVDYSGGTLIIDDDGAGMTREQLINGFMRISSTSKYTNLFLQYMEEAEQVRKELVTSPPNVLVIN